jgi:tetratricopeptide (TPR) repeat protein
MSKVVIPKWLIAGAAGLAVIAFTPEIGFSAGDPPPQPKPKCKGKNCKDQDHHDDAIYSLGYWQAKSGEHAVALATLRTAKNQADPRIQTMIGFSLRKMGRVDEAIGYYMAALAKKPSLTTTRQYLGEAFLQKGEPAKARDQLAEIGKRCGTACEDYTALADEIARYEKS